MTTYSIPPDIVRAAVRRAYERQQEDRELNELMRRLSDDIVNGFSIPYESVACPPSYQYHDDAISLFGLYGQWINNTMPGAWTTGMKEW